VYYEPETLRLAGVMETGVNVYSETM